MRREVEQGANRNRRADHWVYLDRSWAQRLGVTRTAGTYRIRSRELFRRLSRENLGQAIRAEEVAVVTLHAEEPLAVAVVAAIHTGDVVALKRLLAENPDLATARLGDDDPCGMSRTLLHVATDWPGYFPNGAATVVALAEAGADVNARFHGPHGETPLHWAASSDDVDVLDALIDAGADMEAVGAVIGGGTPLADARGFRQWRAARRLVQRGAQTTLTDAATLGLIARVENYFAGTAPPTPEEVNRAFWGACHGGQQRCTEYLLGRGADLSWIPPWEELTPLDAAQRSDAAELVQWLRGRGARSAMELSR